MREAKLKFQHKKALLTEPHILFQVMAVAGTSVMYLNENYGKGIQWIEKKDYEDSEPFYTQVANDVEGIFKYVGYRDMFETDGALDMKKPIVAIDDGPGYSDVWSLDDVIRYAKKRGYYLDENYSVGGIPMSMDDDDDNYEVTADFKKYNPNFNPNNGDFTQGERILMEDLALEILESLGQYYKIYHNYIENGSNFRFQIVYENGNGQKRRYSNVPNMTLEQLIGSGKYFYLRGDSTRIDTNMDAVPVNAAPLLEVWNPYGNEKNYMAVSVDTEYPVDDDYAEAARAYTQSRNFFITAMGFVAVGIVGGFATLVLLMMLSGHETERYDETRLFPIDRLYTELSLLLWVGAMAVALYVGEYIGLHVARLFVADDQIYFWKSMIRLLIVYASAVLCGFSLIRRYKAGTLWTNSMARRVVIALQEHMRRASYSAGIGICYLLFLIGNALMLWIVLMLFLFRGEGLGYSLFFYALVFCFIAADGLIYHQIFKKALQRDLLDEAIKKLSQGNTGHLIDTDRLSGKEKDMGDHINNISSGLGSALKEQVKSERMKADLITNVSHDIKTPLTSIINYVDLLKRQNISDPKVAGYLEILDQKSQRLKTLTEDLVEASKASSGNLKLDFADIDFVELVQQTNGEFEERFAQRHLELVSSLPEERLIIKADGRRLWRVLENLYTNVFKYAMEYSRVYVDMVQNNGTVVFTIKNVSETPLNISPDELTERFVRGDVARTTEGSGLGLSIAQSLTELQSGAFHLEIDGDLFKAVLEFPEEQTEPPEEDES